MCVFFFVWKKLLEKIVLKLILKEHLSLSYNTQNPISFYRLLTKTVII